MHRWRGNGVLAPDLQPGSKSSKCVPTTRLRPFGCRFVTEIRYIETMLALVAAGALLLGPPILPEDPSPPAAIEGPVEGPAPAEAAPSEPALVVDEEPAFVIAPAPPEPVVEPPSAELEPANPSVIVVAPPKLEFSPHPAGPWSRTSTKPPWSGSGRFVGGAFMMVIGTGLLVAATIEFADGRDTTKPMISNLPGGIGSLVAGGIMIGTGVRDQHRLSDWEAVHDHRAKPSGNGLIVAGVATTALGGLAAIATSIASDMDLVAPRSIPAGWATAGVGLGGGAVMLIAGIVRRAKYDRAYATPTLAPTRGGASIGVAGRF